MIKQGAEITQRLTLRPIKNEDGTYKYGGLVPARLVDVVLTENEVTKGEFEGETVKGIRFEFENLPVANEPARYLTYIASINGTKRRIDRNDPESGYEDMTEKTIDEITTSMYMHIANINVALSGNPNYKAIDKIPAADFKKYITPINDTSLKGKDRVKAYNTFFDFIYSIFENDGKPQWHTEKQKYTPVWLLLEPNYPSRKWYTIPNYVKKGFIEPLHFTKEGKLIPARKLEITNLASLELGSSAKTVTDDGITSAVSDDVNEILGLGN